MKKEVTRSEIDEELHKSRKKLDSVSDIVRRYENLFEDREDYHDDNFIEWFKEFYP